MEPITIEITILKPVAEVWDYFTKPEHITKWNFSNDQWESPSAENDLRVGGSFNYRMEQKDDEYGFNSRGIYDEIIPHQKIQYHFEDGRKVEVFFESLEGNMTRVTQVFEPDPEQPAQMQRDGWYGILDNFHKYAENNLAG